MKKNSLLLFLILLISSCNSQNTKKNLYPVKVNNQKYGYMDASGKLIFKTNFHLALDFSEGMAAVREKGYFGYIDKTGKILIKPNYIDAKKFKNGVAIVKNKEGKEIYIDHNGNKININLIEHYKLNDFNENLAVINTKDGKGFINKEGKTIIKPQYKVARNFNDGLALVSKYGSRYGYINTSGEYVIEPKYYMASNFSNGIAAVKDEGYKTKFINVKGEIILEITSDYTCNNFHEGLAKFYDEKMYGDGFVNKKGEIVIEPVKNRSMENFNGGVALFVSKKEIGLLDKKGEVLFRKKSDEISIIKVSEDIVLFSKHANKPLTKTLYGYMDLKGNIIVEAIFSEAESFKNNIARVYYPNKGYRYINKKGNIIQPRE